MFCEQRMASIDTILLGAFAQRAAATRSFVNEADDGPRRLALHGLGSSPSFLLCHPNPEPASLVLLDELNSR
jgi:hypothetical protein